MSLSPFSFHYGPRLHAGPGASARVGELFASRRVLFVTDATVLELGLARPAIAALEASGGEVVLFDAVEPDPSLATVLAAQTLGRDEDVEAVVGLGGGSPMDVAKLVAYLLGSGDDVETLSLHGELISTMRLRGRFTLRRILEWSPPDAQRYGAYSISCGRSISWTSKTTRTLTRHC